MIIENTDIITLKDLNRLRTAPILNDKQSEYLFNEVYNIIAKADWLTIGVMAPSLEEGLNTMRQFEEKFQIKEMKCVSELTSGGPVYLKANQKTGEINARIEYGLGKGILISCQNNDIAITANTVGPFPLDFFK